MCYGVLMELPVICCEPIAGPALSDSEASGLAGLFKALADRHRVKIVNLLLAAGDDAVCVCDLVATLDLAQPTVSYHLGLLGKAGLVDRSKKGTFAYYRIRPGALEQIRALLAPEPVPA